MPEYTLEDLKPTGSNICHTEPTGELTRLRNGRMAPVTTCVEYVPTKTGEISEEKWVEYMLAAVEREGKADLLEKIKEHCRNLAWLKTEKTVEVYALKCLVHKSYKAWWTI